ncbi:hypothetical protein [Pseudomonas aeruginosa]|nr:hypothetical protein [Pseudomonas aeruginosa]
MKLHELREKRTAAVEGMRKLVDTASAAGPDRVKTLASSLL